MTTKKALLSSLFCFVFVFSSSLIAHSEESLFTTYPISKNTKLSQRTTFITVTNQGASNTTEPSIEALVKFQGPVNKGDKVTLTYTAERPYNERIFGVFTNRITYNDLGNLFDKEEFIQDNQLTIVLTAKENNLLSPQMSIIFEREVLHPSQFDENTQFTIKNTSEFNGNIVENSPILVDSQYHDFKVGTIEAGISSANYWYADKLSAGFEDLPGWLNENTISSAKPFQYKRNTTEGVFYPHATLHYGLVDPSKTAKKVRFNFRPKVLNNMVWDSVNLYHENQTTGESSITNKVELKKEGDTYYYEAETSNIDGITQDELFAFGIKVENLSFDPAEETALFFDTYLYDENDELIDFDPHINGISFYSESGSEWYPTITTREDFSILVGEIPDYRKDLIAIDPQINGTDLDITDRVIIDDSAVNLNKAGTYPVRYTVTDDEGYMATHTLKLTVIDTRVTINYVDENNDFLSSVVIPAQNPGETFSKNSPEFDGYILQDNSQATITGTFTDNPQTITVKYKKGVTMTVKYINKESNTPIYQNIDTKELKSEDEHMVYLTNTVKENLDQLVSQNQMNLNYEGYKNITTDDYVILDGENETKPTTVPKHDFTLILYYTGTLYIKDAPDISFGEVTRTLFGKTTVKPVQQSTTGNLVLVNTTGQDNWKLTASLPKGIYSKTDESIKLQSDLIFKNPANSNKLMLNNMPGEVVTNQQLTLDPLGMIDLDSSFKLDVYSKNDIGDYTGTVLWSLDRVP